MQNGAMKAWLDSSYLSGSNQSWIEQLYEDCNRILTLLTPTGVQCSSSYLAPELNRINFIPKRVIISVDWRRMPHVTLFDFRPDTQCEAG